jgi:hypothetical protein
LLLRLLEDVQRVVAESVSVQQPRRPARGQRGVDGCLDAGDLSIHRLRRLHGESACHIDRQRPPLIGQRLVDGIVIPIGHSGRRHPARAPTKQQLQGPPIPESQSRQRLRHPSITIGRAVHRRATWPRPSTLTVRVTHHFHRSVASPSRKLCRNWSCREYACSPLDLVGFMSHFSDRQRIQRLTEEITIRVATGYGEAPRDKTVTRTKDVTKVRTARAGNVHVMTRLSVRPRVEPAHTRRHRRWSFTQSRTGRGRAVSTFNGVNTLVSCNTVATTPHGVRTWKRLGRFWSGLGQRVRPEDRAGGRYRDPVADESQASEHTVVAEDTRAGAEQERVDHQPDFVDQVVFEQRCHQRSVRVSFRVWTGRRHRSPAVTFVQRWRRETSVPWVWAGVSCWFCRRWLVPGRRVSGWRVPGCVWLVLRPPWAPGSAARRPEPRPRSRPP